MQVFPPLRHALVTDFGTYFVKDGKVMVPLPFKAHVHHVLSFTKGMFFFRTSSICFGAVQQHPHGHWSSMKVLWTKQKLRLLSKTA